MPQTARTLRAVPVAALLVFLALPAAAQSRSRDRDSDRCSDWGDRGMERVCIVTESTISDPHATLKIDGRTNGGITVYGSSRRDILVRAKIVTNARTRERAQELTEEIKIHTDGGRIYADGPDTHNREWWSVEFEVEVPSRTDLDLRAQNGGISVADVSGMLRMETMNGGIHLESVNGDVVAETTNGGLNVDLDGEGWVGRGLEATTTNGGVHLQVSKEYSAHLETGTVNGGVDIDFPVTVQGKIGRRITTDLGKGGATIRVVTTNGGVDVRRGY